MMNGEGLNRGQHADEPHVKCELTVIPMEGWERDMLYEDTGLPWILPSPNIPTSQAALCYPASGICGELYGFLNIGIGYTLPFGLFGADWMDAGKLKERLDSYNIPGVSFRTAFYKPFSGRLKDRLVQGVQFFFTDYEEAPVTLLQFYVMQAVSELWPEQKPSAFGLFDKVCGTDHIRKTFFNRWKVEDILPYWSKDVDEFKELSKKYILY